MANRKYEVLNGIRLPDGELKTDGLITLDDKDPDTHKFLAFGAIRLVPGQDAAEEGEPTTHTAPVSPAPPAPPTADARPLTDVLEPDLAAALLEGGYATVGQVRDATDEDLLALAKVGTGRLKKIRAELA